MIFEPSTVANPLVGLVIILRGLIKAPFKVSLTKVLIVIPIFSLVVAKSFTATGNNMVSQNTFTFSVSVQPVKVFVKITVCKPPVNAI